MGEPKLPKRRGDGRFCVEVILRVNTAEPDASDLALEGAPSLVVGRAGLFPSV